MREIKLSGREAVVIRAIGFAVGVSGQELLEATRIEPEQSAIQMKWSGREVICPPGRRGIGAAEPA